MRSKYVCECHRKLFTTEITPCSPYKKKCVNCFKNVIEGYAHIFQTATPEYNYLFPMLCNHCSELNRKCRWCRPIKQRILQNLKI